MPAFRLFRFPAPYALPAVLVLLAAVPHAPARTPVEGIVAMVGDAPVLFSEVEELRQGMLQQQPGFARLTEREQRAEALERIIDDKVVLARARQDTSIVVSEQEVNARVSDMYARVVRQQGGESQLEAALRQATGMSLGQFKERMAGQVRENLLRQQLQMKYVGDPQPSRLQVREFFETYRDSLPVQRNVTRLSHLQWRIKADDSIETAARERAAALITRLRNGESFAELARLHSDDGSGRAGGDLGYTRRGTLDPDFERAAFALDAGDYTRRPVRTRFGYHVIRVTSKRDNEVRASHILIRVIPSPADTARARAFLDSLRGTLGSQEDFRATARRFSDDRQTRDLGGDLGWFSRDSLSGVYKSAVDTLPEGGVGSPVLIEDSWHLFRVDRKEDVRRFSLEEDYALISRYAREWLIGERLASLIENWRKQTHIGNRLDQFTPSTSAETRTPTE